MPWGTWSPRRQVMPMVYRPSPPHPCTTLQACIRCVYNRYLAPRFTLLFFYFIMIMHKLSVFGKRMRALLLCAVILRSELDNINFSLILMLFRTISCCIYFFSWGNFSTLQCITLRRPMSNLTGRSFYFFEFHERFQLITAIRNHSEFLPLRKLTI